MLRRPTKAAFLILLLGACASQKPVTQEAWARTEGVQYRCEQDKGFVASFAPDGGRAAIKLGETVYDVPQVVSGSGIHYKSDDIDFIGKGRDAELLASPNGPYEKCRVIGS